MPKGQKEKTKQIPTTYFLSKSQEKYFNTAESALLVLELKTGAILAANKAFEILSGYKVAALLKEQWELLDTFKNKKHRKQFSSSLAQQTGNFPKLVFMSLANGERQVVELNKGEAIARGYVLITVRARRSLEDIIDLFNKEQHLKGQFIHGMSDGIVITDPKGKCIDVNPAYLEMTGIERHEIMGQMPPYHWAGEVFEELISLRVPGKGTPQSSFDANFIRKDGSRFPVSVATSVLYDADGNVSSNVTVVRDRSKLSRSESLLEKQKKYSDRVIQGLQEGLAIIDVSGEFLETNPAFCRMLGLERDEIVGKKPPYAYWPPEHIDEIKEAFGRLKTGEDEQFQLTFMRKNGERFPAWISVTHLRNEKGVVTTHITTITDITERYQYENKLRLANEFSSSLINSLHEGLMVMDLNSKIIDINPAFCEMLGFKEAELLGMQMPFDFLPKDDIAVFNACLDKVLAGKADDQMYFEFQKKDGVKFPISAQSAVIRDKEGNIIAHYCTIQDISDQVRLMEQKTLLAEQSDRKKQAILELAGLVGSDYMTALQRITSLAAEILEVERVSVWKLDDDFSMIVCEDLYKRSEDEHEEGMILTRVDHPEYFHSLSQNKTIAVSAAQTHPATRSFATDYLIPNSITSMMDVFVQGLKKDHGIICFEHVGEARQWKSEEEQFATSIASLVSLIIQSQQRIKAEKELQAVNQELSEAFKELNKLKNQLQDQNVYLRNELDMVFNFEEMVYGSAAFSQVLTDLEQVAPTPAGVLLLGESGTGKELLARAVHNLSDRRNNPLIKVNCAAIPQELIESELFGHKKGSFTGAIADKIGKVELADGGSLFLDEIGELPLSMQPKLLRFLQEGEIEMIGDPKVRKVDVRVIAATNKDLKEEVAKKRFREDLFFRLNVFPIHVPALRERREDIPVLVEHFVDKYSKSYRKNIQYISDTTMRKMKSYDWPGNVRELENIVERAVILCNSDTLRIVEFETPGQTVGGAQQRTIQQQTLSLDEVQRDHIIKVLEHCQWVIDGETGAAHRLGLKPSTLRDRMKKLKIQRPI
ncbi:sigma 54-interacting transcriptional regulator [Gilvibacter sp.]|uniref:sigma 54-interacting transcriptional regulator n=1 Tax=Gilvibacter sp. TaxID=2729997 RepID=UPI003B51A48A